jgi:hypothetical protein
MEMTADPTLRYKCFLDIIGFGFGSGFGIANSKADCKTGEAVFNLTVFNLIVFDLTLREMRRL